MNKDEKSAAPNENQQRDISHSMVDPAVKPDFYLEIDQQPPLTIIIPTATFRRPLLEKCLSSAVRFSHPQQTRFVVIDNASVDDTSEFLADFSQTCPQLTILSNIQNPGVAAAFNQGLSKAEDGLVMLLHNDVELKSPLGARLGNILLNHKDIGLIAPKADRSWNPAQLTANTGGHPPVTGKEPFTDTDLLDGYCMVFRNLPGLAMDKNYGLAYFEDADFVFRIREKGFRTVIAINEEVSHLFGVTTADLGLNLHGKGYWKNSALFHRQWNIEPRFPEELRQEDPLKQFVVLGRLINPFYPEKHLLDYFTELFSSEEKTRVFHTRFPKEELKHIIRLMMAANQREILRRLEEQLEEELPDPGLYHDLIVFYYERLIYSRCKKYLMRLDIQPLPVEFSFFELQIAMGEKDYSAAARHLSELMERSPTHPGVLLAASEIHRRNGNMAQCEKFLALARKFQPDIRN